MTIRTPLCPLLGIDTPLVQAPIGSATTPRLAAAVSEAGGLGTLALSWVPLNEVGDRVSKTRTLTDKPFGVNLVLPWTQHERVRLCLDAGASIVSTAWGDPAPYVDDVHSAGAIHIHMVGSVREAVTAVETGVDAIVAQGWEAGGHVQGQVTTAALVPAVVGAVHPIPVIAAGGMGTGRALVAALALGAAGVWVGTRFLLAEEAAVHDVYRQELIDATEDSTVYSQLFNIGWEAPHRTLTNSTVEMWEREGRPVTGRPGEGEIVATLRGKGIVRYADALAVPDVQGDVEALPLYAGQSVGSATGVTPARDIVEEIRTEAFHVLQQFKDRLE